MLVGTKAILTDLYLNNSNVLYGKSVTAKIKSYRIDLIFLRFTKDSNNWVHSKTYYGKLQVLLIELNTDTQTILF